MASNNSLSSARTARKDEFYTQLTDIEKELRHYRQHFKGKTVLCNCDDPFESNFFKFFVLNFNRLGLKKLIATSYVGSPIANSQFPLLAIIEGIEDENKPYKAIVTTVYDKTGDGGVDMLDVAELFKSGENELSELKGDGDFRSEECLALLDEADIVVTNPPFSLFRQYVTTLMEHNKKFIIIGHQNAITYKEVFPLIKDNKIWLGNGFSGNVGFFESPYEDIAVSSQHKEGLIRVSGVYWFTNMDIKKRHEELILVKRYNPKDYPKYDNYDAIEVSKTVDIPCDYDGYMGVPITFLDKYNPDQFEIIWQAAGNSYANAPKEVLAKLKFDPTIKYGGGLGAGVVGGKAKYARIIIRNKHPETPKEN